MADASATWPEIRLYPIGFTGTQLALTSAQGITLRRIMYDIGVCEFHHGDCVGADATAAGIARNIGMIIVSHPPKNPRKRANAHCNVTREPKEYLVRNKDIVNETRELIACPKGSIEELRSGTWATIRYARAQRKKITIIFPDGTVRVEKG